MSQAASFWHFKSPSLATSTNGRVTAAIFDVISAARWTMKISELTRNLDNNGQAPAARTESIWVSLPLTILPIIFRVGSMTSFSLWLSKDTSLGMTSASTTYCIRLLGSSVSQNRAQQAPDRISSSLLLIRWARAGRSCLTENTVSGLSKLPLKLPKVEVTIPNNVK